MDGRKEARVVEYQGRKVLDFNKGKSTHVPPTIFFRGDVTCQLVRDGVHQRNKSLKQKNLAARGIIADELKIGDKLVLDYVDDKTFYRILRDHAHVHDRVFVWLDPDLETALKNLSTSPLA